MHAAMEKRSHLQMMDDTYILNNNYMSEIQLLRFIKNVKMNRDYFFQK